MIQVAEPVAPELFAGLTRTLQTVYTYRKAVDELQTKMATKKDDG